MKLETMSSQRQVTVTGELCENKKEHNWNRAQIRWMDDSNNKQNARMHQFELGSQRIPRRHSSLAAKANAERLGCGKMKHISVKYRYEKQCC